MATGRFNARRVMDRAGQLIEQKKNELAAAREAAIKELMSSPRRIGVWPFRRDHWMTREEAEAFYKEGHAEDWYFETLEYAVEGTMRKKIRELQRLYDLARPAAERTCVMDAGDMLELGVLEIRLLGFHEANA